MDRFIAVADNWIAVIFILGFIFFAIFQCRTTKFSKQGRLGMLMDCILNFMQFGSIFGGLCIAFAIIAITMSPEYSEENYADVSTLRMRRFGFHLILRHHNRKEDNRGTIRYKEHADCNVATEQDCTALCRDWRKSAGVRAIELRADSEEGMTHGY